MRSPLFLRELLASIRERVIADRTASMKTGAQISRLLQELLGTPKARQVAPLATEGRRSESQVDDVRAARKEIESHGVGFVKDVDGNESEAWTYFSGTRRLPIRALADTSSFESPTGGERASRLAPNYT